ncbi:carboxylesterase family protein [Rhodoferax sp. AJA081-3]|uniref:carboxylesterase/lipase family protein n=1 Tax=Rhodoferax sp. AJA081-3 TaxID=2752316 RepID=UPI001AE08E61|nr:carboxylesterase family protein [Rhodoferax sp. AJA081-3]QTN28612.1 carboxylesterase family protein [Rhodoferax sp. AJA081-3]
MKVASRILWAPCVAIAALVGACGGTGNGVDPALSRSTSYGVVVGSDDAAGSGTYAWKGIPFAKAPVGALRWKAPVEPDAWQGQLVTKAFGNACLQNGRIYGPGANNRYDSTIASTLNTPVGHEDCLTLNVWRPANDSANLPVIVFVYGGSNISGYTADPVYDGAALAKAANAVVVTTNYRLGILGFMNLPQLKTGTDAASDSGNFALLDIVQALKFVKKNAAAFGGAADNVTLMGQSAGAINTWALMASPLAAGLFHKVVPISGGISLASNLPAGMLPTLNPASTYLAQGNGLLVKLLVADGKAVDAAAAAAYIATQSSAQIADYLRAKSGASILSTLLANGLTGSGPIPDGVVVPTDPIAAMAAGRYNKVPVLAGNTADEGKLFAPFLTLLGGKPGHKISDAERFALMANFNPDAPTTLTAADILDASYLPVTTPVTGFNAKTALLGNVFTAPSRDNVLNTLATQQAGSVWHYQFNWAQEPAPWNAVYGAAHAFDLPFLFGNFGPSVFSNAVNSSANKAGRVALSSAMMASLGNFVRTGNPNAAPLGTTWQPWPKKLVFDATLNQALISSQ